MVFLNPSVLIGLLAATIPVLIHILNFKKLKKIEFGTLVFLKELQKSKIKKIKIKQWLLLILRTLIIIFLVMAFARPTLESTFLNGTTSIAKSTSVFIIDNSFSMTYVKDNGSLFNKSKTEAKKIINQMQNENEFYFVISKDSVLHYTNKNVALKFISDYNITFLTEALNKKIKKAVQILAETKNINKEIFLFSDFQKSTFADSLENNFNKHPSIKLYSFDFGINNVANLSIENLKPENSILELNKPVTFSAIVNNYSGNKTGNITASLFFNNKRVAQKNISLQANSRKKIKFVTTLQFTGLIEAKARLDDDNILQDNITYLSFYVPEKIKILLLYDNPNDVKFLKAVFNSSLLKQKFEVTEFNTKKNYNNNFKGYDALFLISTKNDVIKKLKKVIISGTNLIFIPPGKTELQDLQKLNTTLKIPKAKQIIESSKDKKDYAEFGKINLLHPLFRNLFDVKNKNKIESPRFFKYIDYVNSFNVFPVIQFNTKATFLGEYKLGKGKILFLNSACNLAWSNFPVKGIFAPLIAKIVYYLSSRNAVYNNYVVGNKIPINISNVVYPLLKIKFTNGSDNVNLNNYNKKIFEYKKTNLPGNYKFLSNNKLIKFASVNANPIESDLTKINTDVKNEYFKKIFKNNFININPKENYIGKIKEARYGTELWKPFLIIAFLLALIEMFVAHNTKNDIMNLEDK